MVPRRWEDPNGTLWRVRLQQERARGLGPPPCSLLGCCCWRPEGRGVVFLLQVIHEGSEQSGIGTTSPPDLITSVFFGMVDVVSNFHDWMSWRVLLGVVCL